MFASCFVRHLKGSSLRGIVLQVRGISGAEYQQVDWDAPALKYLRYIGVDIPNMIRLYKRLGKTKYFTRDTVADLVEFFDMVGVRGNSIKDAMICAPDLLRVPVEVLEARGCWYRDVFEFSHQEFRMVLELYPNLLEDRTTKRFEEAIQYYKELGISREDFRSMLLKCPTILHNSIQDSVSKVVDYFLDRGVDKAEVIEAMLAFPEMLNYSLMGHILPKAYYFESELDIPQTEFARVFIKHGWILGLNLESDIRHTVQWLLDFGASKKALGNVIMKFPSILGYSVENNFKPKIDYFIHYLGMPFGELALIIEKQPGFVGASLREHVRPFVWCLEHELSMPVDGIRKVFTREPSLFGFSYAEVVKPTIDYFIEDIGCRRDHFANMLIRFPQLLCYSLEENIKPRVQWLRETAGIPEDKIAVVALHRIYPYTIETLNNKLQFVRSQLDISHEQLVSMICEDASILHKSLANLAKKIQFLETELKRERREILSCPKYLAFSFDSRIRFRIEFLNSTETDFASKSLKALFDCSEQDFVQSLPKKKQSPYDGFKAEYMKRQQATESEEDEKEEEQMLEQTFVQEQTTAPIEEVREAERRFARKFKYQTVLE